MKMNKKGFTLIELLAVIVILAVIALIATPIIMNVINDAKEGANRDAAYGIAKSIEQAIAQKMVKDSTYNPTCAVNTAVTATIAEGKVTVCGVDASFKGTKPSAVTVKMNDKNVLGSGTVIKFGTKTYTMDASGEFK